MFKLALGMDRGILYHIILYHIILYNISEGGAGHRGSALVSHC